MDIILTLLDYSIEQCIDEFNRFSVDIQDFQVDIQDGRFVTNKTISVAQFDQAISSFNQLRLKRCRFDFHLQVIDYEKNLQTIDKLKNKIRINNIFIHYSLSPNIVSLQKNYPEFSLCLVLNPNDDVLECDKKYNLSAMPGIQIMSIYPGPQGQGFIKESLNKIEQLRSLGYRSPIYLDGAINLKTIQIIMARKFRPDVLCVGSFFTKAPSLKGPLTRLRTQISKPDKLGRHGIVPSGKVYRNLTVSRLVAKSLANQETVSSKSGASVVFTGKYTGRSPKDKFIVDSPSWHDKINWNATNQSVDTNTFDRLYKKMSKHLSASPELFIFDGIAGADPQYALNVRVVSEYAYQALFIRHLLRRPSNEELKKHEPRLTILSAPTCFADPKKDGTRSEVFIVVDLERMLVLIGGTKYSGEIKKSIFSTLNILLPQKHVFPMHCSANVGDDGKSALFFGLSGTGKTTLSADPKRRLIGDDEHGWSKNGIFNFEGGCYAKCINLKKESEPQIFAAIRQGALLENVVVKKDGSFDFDDTSLTENTRAAYPIEFIENAVLDGIGPHPQSIIFLTADATGVLPPIAKLSIMGALYHFLSGYTSKLAGTERGVKEPQPTFSPFFGGPFMALKPMVYVKLLQDYVTKYKTKVYLVNTGWSGGQYGVGQRISLKDTRIIVSSLLNGALDQVKYRHDDLFNLDVPVCTPGVQTQLLNPRDLWKDKNEYYKKARELAGLFIENFKKFTTIPKNIINSGPHL